MKRRTPTRSIRRKHTFLALELYIWFFLLCADLLIRLPLPRWAFLLRCSEVERAHVHVGEAGDMQGRNRGSVFIGRDLRGEETIPYLIS